eukprot:923394-Amphidinium_carterae.1
MSRRLWTLTTALTVRTMRITRPRNTQHSIAHGAWRFQRAPETTTSRSVTALKGNKTGTIVASR